MDAKYPTEEDMKEDSSSSTNTSWCNPKHFKITAIVPMHDPSMGALGI